ncbi:lipid droplet-regulating VLDL assembly factor AUP1 isoform X1 [Dunckerocampus dactyliophorus]|uniref:lipid droplet-regulating VLDL assembly factor AUP1 isoform X1 n=1 Tax=Dunckerocampus dactyliophorus TaxID=161453 RepID=UPI002407707A|nr:lipid droplet-regulating VLDL assembly factor AUP1 isoform X1 [Dunckerocampus dactyliophorus]XP_054648751.1 lipid droplet-regulating VLDL assembly factor AUP1 isoform X1 [Dunckerocampus dactyliophorus]
MEAPGIEDMIDFRRLPKDTLVLLLLLLYFPVGICLMLLRIFIGIHVFLVSCALPESFLRRFIVRVMCSVLGMHVRQKNHRSRDRNTKLYICNHVTEFDHNIINLLTPCCTPQLEGSTGFVCWARGFMEVRLAPGQGAIGESLQRYCSTEGASPLLLLPEEDTTNGHSGLLKFSSWPFSLTDSIQPVALRVARPLIALSTPESSWLTELLWTFFAPFTVYHVSWLPPVSRQDGESSQEFANKVQELLACELGLVSTKITKADKAEHIKRKRHAVPQTSSSARPGSIGLGFMVPSLGTDERRIAKMAQQVKDVLPHMPLHVIVKDLAKTNCVDITITNLLENKEEASVEDTGMSSFGASMNSTHTSGSAPTIKPAAKSFGKSPADRHLSLQERKEALYNFARRRYIEKHGLDQEYSQ